jgi:hypothetical protein
MAGGFKRSGRFGLIGVFVVAAPLGLEVTERPQVSIGVTTPMPQFKAKSRDGEVRPGDGTPESVASALSSVPNSTRWKKVTVEGGPGGIVVARKGGAQSDWLGDLWLAERLAKA